jgi:hypothetical protein
MAAGWLFAHAAFIPIIYNQPLRSYWRDWSASIWISKMCLVLGLMGWCITIYSPWGALAAVIFMIAHAAFAIRI